MRIGSITESGVAHRLAETGLHTGDFNNITMIVISAINEVQTR